ncbi:cytochrome P450 [Mycena rosella]|uniref:Cytochrome P450 n=1 Tax=Mycena rosella TaxID=1033263 RepID=A0AAD7CW15_MYCRO|nr:cytochrome P450 [Mycena rosella]
MPPTVRVAVIYALPILAICGARALWRRLFAVLDNIPGPPLKSLFTGNLLQYHDPDGWAFHKNLEENYGGVVKLNGFFGVRQLYVFDPAALDSILVKDQDLYEEIPQNMCMNRLLFGKGIISTIGDDHRRYRKIMLPAFSTANLRGMVPLFYDVVEQARDNLIAPNVGEGSQMLDFNSILGRTALELIGRTGIGYSFDPMLPGQEQNDRYAASLKGLFPAAMKLVLLGPVLPFIEKLPFPSFRHFLINFIPIPALHQLRNLVDFTDAAATKLVRDRKAAIKSGEVCVEDDAKDIMSLLVKSNMSAESGMYLTDKELVAATSIIISAATDTTSAAMNRIFHTLALYPAVQEKLRAEILASSERLDYSALEALPYLDAVVHEILRLYPPATPGMFRETCEDTVLPLSTPIVGVDGTPMKTIAIPKGTTIYIAIAAVNHSKEIWGEDALEFKPERWTHGRANSVTTKTCGIYGNTMTFLGGGRGCIGLKFSELEIKVVTCVLLRSFKLSSPDPNIQWRITGIIPSPNVDNQPSLPILVERLSLATC